ncbi:MAG: serine protease [Halodesulfurarchaeum sp.]
MDSNTAGDKLRIDGLEQLYPNSRISPTLAAPVMSIGTTLKSGEWHATGSGFLWEKDDQVVTAFHVIEQLLERDAPIEAKTKSKIKLKCNVSNYSPRESDNGRDWAILNLPNEEPPDPNPLSPGDNEIEAGETVLFYGYPGDLADRNGVTQEIHRGFIDNVADGGFTLTRPIPKGFSGGPVLEAETRNLVGYLVGNSQPPKSWVKGYGYTVRAIER